MYGGKGRRRFSQSLLPRQGYRRLMDILTVTDCLPDLVQDAVSGLTLLPTLHFRHMSISGTVLLMVVFLLLSIWNWERYGILAMRVPVCLSLRPSVWISADIRSSSGISMFQRNMLNRQFLLTTIFHSERQFHSDENIFLAFAEKLWKISANNPESLLSRVFFYGEIVGIMEVFV